MFACNGILFNHESPLRGETFVSRKITRGVAAIATGKGGTIYLGNLDAQRDWGHAKDYVEGMWKMLQHPEPIDFVLATGITTTIREFVRIAFEKINVTIKFAGKGIHEVGIVAKNEGPLLKAPFLDCGYLQPINFSPALTRNPYGVGGTIGKRGNTSL